MSAHSSVEGGGVPEMLERLRQVGPAGVPQRLPGAWLGVAWLVSLRMFLNCKGFRAASNVLGWG